MSLEAGLPVKATDGDHVETDDSLPHWTGWLTFTDAQIKAAPTTPLTLVAAPGAGRRHIFHRALAVFDTAGGGYTNIDAGYAEVYVGVGGLYSSGLLNNATHSQVTQLLDGSVPDARVDFLPEPQGVNVDYGFFAVIDTAEDEPIRLDIANDSGDLTGGDAANSVKVMVEFSTLTLP